VWAILQGEKRQAQSALRIVLVCDSDRMDAVIEFLDLLSISTRVTPIEDLYACADNSLYIFCLQSPAQAQS
jgi:hypothetical protein